MSSVIFSPQLFLFFLPVWSCLDLWVFLRFFLILCCTSAYLPVGVAAGAGLVAHLTHLWLHSLPPLYKSGAALQSHFSCFPCALFSEELICSSLLVPVWIKYLCSGSVSLVFWSPRLHESYPASISSFKEVISTCQPQVSSPVHTPLCTSTAIN